MGVESDLNNGNTNGITRQTMINSRPGSRIGLCEIITAIQAHHLRSNEDPQSAGHCLTAASHFTNQVGCYVMSNPGC